MRLKSFAAGLVGLVAALAMAGASAAADAPPVSEQVVAGKADQLLRGPLTQVLGNPNGDVTIVEFFDYACPFCKAIEPRLQALLASDRNVRLVVKEFPILTPASPIATKAAFAAARQGKYAAFHQALMLRRGALTEAGIFETAKSVGLDEARLRRDMQAPEFADAIYANMNLARSLRIVGTPTIIVNNRILTQPSAEMNFPAIVAEARARK